MTAEIPGDGRELLIAGAEAYGRGEIAEALRIFEDACARTEGGVRIGAMVNAASMYDQLGRHSEAIAKYRAVLAEIAEDAVRPRASALINMSQALQHIGDLDGAQTALEQARTLLRGHDELGELRTAYLLSLTAVAMHRQRWVYALELATESLDAAVRFAPHLAGHPLMNMASIHFETGRHELADDFAAQALAAFESAGDNNAAAETRQNLAIMRIRRDRFADAEPYLRASQEYFERAGLGHRAGIGYKMLGFLAERREDFTEARAFYDRALHYFLETGASIDAADVRIRLATLIFTTGHQDSGSATQHLNAAEQLLAEARTTYAESGLGLHCAQLDFWHAALLEALVDNAAHVDPRLLTVAVDIAVPAALAIDAVRYTLPNGRQRDQWHRRIADPAMRLAFRFAYLSGNTELLADLIATKCAGTTLRIDRSETAARLRIPFEIMAPDATPPPPLRTALQLGSALADIAADAGLPVTAPPRLTVSGGRIALADYIAAAEQRYQRNIRADKVIPA
ncbi:MULTISPECIES: lipopolysaccharide assembly protein LapB [unclassified Nocardia]|uniref:tetratricopeptide repeat protein n=1 Tax=unclassified Nocardia TaxID=2637762 RepID=UPI001CE4948A|nr:MULTISPECIES: tetratricopeptide repeat protein [unclassified Nocardia]